MSYYYFSGRYEYPGGVMGGMPAESEREVREAVLRDFPDLRVLELRIAPQLPNIRLREIKPVPEEF